MSALWIAFYSVRGGVGRSTTLVLTALDLARRGHRVAVIDFDLESPGLDILLAADGKNSEHQPQRGVVDFLDARLLERQLDVEDIIFSLELPGDYTGRLFLIPAGRCDSTYLASLDRLDLRKMYERSGLLNPVRALRAELEEALDPDIVLVDSRTGYSDAALVTLFDLADAAVVVMVPDLQNVVRLKPVLDRLVRVPRKPQLVLVANKCQMSTPAMRAITDIEERLRAVVPADPNEDEEERPFLHKISFESAFSWAQRLFPPPPLSDARQKLGERIHKMVEDRKQPVSTPAELPIPEDTLSKRKRLLAHLEFGEDTAETDSGLLDAFLFSPKVTEALRPERWLIRGRKGAGKSAIFRVLTERPEKTHQHCPELKDWVLVAAHGDPWTGRKYLRAEDFQAIRRLIESGKAAWKDLWRMYAVAQAVRSFPELATTELRRRAARLFEVKVEERPEALGQLLESRAHAWVGELQALVAKGAPGLLFVYDHLDAGFGSEIKDFALRREAVTGLLDAWTADIDPSRPLLLPKILLREDVFASLSLANINRWRARDVELRWDFAHLADCLAERARKKDVLRGYLEEHSKMLEHVPVEARSFVTLFDERVRPREKQARTWLTVSNRLRDVVGNLFPRDFMRLGVEALSLEKQDSAARRYFEPALIAGAHTLAALPKVSERRVHDLKDEFSDYAPLLAALQGLRSPFDEKDLLGRFLLAQDQEMTPEHKQKLAEDVIHRLKEHGVVGDWADGRLFIPDLYLHGLGMYRAGW
ncbi:MAG TPA: P-loop NTPase [Polyangiaceae bacterium]|nr:P-loop NTPase [Polyangiaceae bacterium]